MTTETRANRPEPTIEAVMAQFRRGRALVEAALAALADLRDELDGGGRRETMAAAVGSATHDGDNLLIGDPARRETTIFVLGRQTGSGVRVQMIAVDRGPIALTRPDDTGPLDRYDAALAANNDGSAARNALRNAIVAAASSLSVVKARLDLQESFLDAVLRDDPAGSPQVIRPVFGQPSIRDLALSVGRQLDRRGISVGSRNRRTLETLFADAMTRGV